MAILCRKYPIGDEECVENIGYAVCGCGVDAAMRLRLERTGPRRNRSYCRLQPHAQGAQDVSEISWQPNLA